MYYRWVLLAPVKYLNIIVSNKFFIVKCVRFQIIRWLAGYYVDVDVVLHLVGTGLCCKYYKASQLVFSRSEVIILSLAV